MYLWTLLFWRVETHAGRAVEVCRAMELNMMASLDDLSGPERYIKWVE